MEFLHSPEVLVTLILAAASAIIWSIRLEGRINTLRDVTNLQINSLTALVSDHAQQLEKVREVQTQDIQRLSKEIGEINVSLAEIRGFLRRMADQK